MENKSKRKLEDILSIEEVDFSKCLSTDNGLSKKQKLIALEILEEGIKLKKNILKEDVLKEEFFESIPYKKAIHMDIGSILKLEPSTIWKYDVHLYDYIIGNFRGLFGQLDSKHLKSNSDFDNFFRIYYKIEVLKKDVLIAMDEVLNKYSSVELEREFFASWKNKIRLIDFGAAFITLFCTCNGRLISELIDNSDIKIVKKCLSELLYFVVFYYENKKIEAYTADEFMAISFQTISKIEGVFFGWNVWRKWTMYNGVKFGIY